MSSLHIDLRLWWEDSWSHSCKQLTTCLRAMLTLVSWTYFPYPVTTHSTLRKDLGGTLYLLGNFYSCVHSTVEMRLNTGMSSNWNRKADKKSPTYRLDKARHKVFQKYGRLMLSHISPTPADSYKDDHDAQ